MAWTAVVTAQTAGPETLGTFATKWIDSWEEDDDTEDFALQLK